MPIAGLLVIMLSFLTSAAFAQTPVSSVELIAMGRAIYESGRLSSGESLQAFRDNGLAVSGKAAACVNCHQRSGFGIYEGSNLVPPITGPHLFANVRPSGHVPRRAQAVEHHQFQFRIRDPYTQSTLARALRDGVSPAGTHFQYLMPRYALNDTDMAALIGYLRQLSSQPSPGATMERAHFATVIAPGQDATRRSAVVDVLRACFNERHPERPAGQVWQLDVWDLDGAPDTWPAQLSAKYARQPVFAMLSGLGSDEWGPVHQFCESEAIPCLFPNIDVPASVETGTNSFYFSKGVVLEAEVIAHHLTGKDASFLKRVIQLRLAAGAGAVAARSMQQSLTAGSLIVEDRIMQQATMEEFQTATADVTNTDAIVVWLDRADLGKLAHASPPGAGMIVLSGWLGGFEFAPLSDAWKRVVHMVYPIDAPQRRAERMRFNLAPWLTGKSIAPADDILLGNTLTACNLLSEAMLRMRGSFYRDYLVEQIENYPTGMGNAPAPQAFPRFLMSPRQRYSSKGAYLVRFKPPEFQTLELVKDWIVPP